MLLSKGKKTGLVMLDGDAPSSSLEQAWLNECDLFICADGAANREYPRLPDAVIGDMDSLVKIPEGVSVHRMDDSDRTDGEKCVIYLNREKCDRIVLLGGTGGRQDHHLVNLALPMSRPEEIMLAGEDFAAVAVWGRQKFKIPLGRGLSIFPLYGSAQGVSLSGVEFPLESADLAFTRGLTASNRSVESLVEIEVLRGRLLLIVERKTGDPLWQDIL